MGDTHQNISVMVGILKSKMAAIWDATFHSASSPDLKNSITFCGVTIIISMCFQAKCPISLLLEGRTRSIVLIYGNKTYER